MHCSSCGAVVARDLSYCNRCGAKLPGVKGNEAAKPTGVSLEYLVWAMVAVFVVGLLAVISLMAVMKGVSPFNEAFIKAFAVLTFVMMFGVEGVFVSLLWRRMRTPREANDMSLLKEPTTKEIDVVAERFLPEPAPSVTEHTTRAFERIIREQKSE